MPDLVSVRQLQLFAPRCDYMVIAPHLSRACQEAEIDTPRELRHFLAQMFVESAGFTRWVEDCNWRTPARLDSIFLSVHGEADAANLIRRGAQAIANRIYAGKNGNGDEASGDGWRYRGRSPAQVTGAANYAEASDWVGVDLKAEPDLVASYPYGAKVAAQWWRHHGLNEIVAADPGERAMAAIDAKLTANEFDDCRAARRVINGPAQLGLTEAQRQLLRAGAIWRD